MKLKKPIENKDIIIAIDIALNTSGVAVMDPRKEVYATFLVKSTPSWKYYQKLDYLYENFIQVFSEILEAKPKSIVLILEDRLKAGFSGATLASIEGSRVTSYHAFRQIFKASQIPTSVVLYDPGTIKKYFTGKRGAKKDAVFKSAVEKNPFLKRYKQEDILDAIYLALYHVNNK
jgi:Holliday junction resolvasome RuvABC endonuclease subunit